MCHIGAIFKQQYHTRNTVASLCICECEHCTVLGVEVSAPCIHVLMCSRILLLIYSTSICICYLSVSFLFSEYLNVLMISFVNQLMLSQIRAVSVETNLELNILLSIASGGVGGDEYVTAQSPFCFIQPVLLTLTASLFLFTYPQYPK